MKIREEFKVREMAGEHVIVMPGRGGAADMTRIVSLNPSSMYLWEKLRGREFTAADAALLLTERYEVAERRTPFVREASTLSVGFRAPPVLA